MSRRSHVRLPKAGRYLPPMGEEFVSIEAVSGLVLLAGVIGALVWANIGGYTAFWVEARIGDLSGRDIVDGLIVLFFFLVGLEIKRELVVGALRDRRAAALPAIAALGGIIVPAAIFGLIAGNSRGVEGWSVPFATDVALAVGVLALLRHRLPSSARLFLLELAIVDDIGTLLLVAVLFSGGVSASLIGVGLAVLVPLRPVRGVHVLERLEHHLLPWVSFVVVPLFALANAGVSLHHAGDALGTRITLGIVAALVFGKVIGVTGATILGLRAGVGRLPEGVGMRHVVGIGLIAGISLTVSLYVADRAFVGAALEHAKIGFLTASLIAGSLGVVWLSIGRRARAGEPPS